MICWVVRAPFRNEVDTDHRTYLDFYQIAHRHAEKVNPKKGIAHHSITMQSKPSSTGRSAISFLGPISSYTHQVFDLRLIKCPSPFFCQHYEPHAIPIGLTDDYHAQAALGCFDQEKYEYQPAIGIPGIGPSNLYAKRWLTIYRCLWCRSIWQGSIRCCSFWELYKRSRDFHPRTSRRSPFALQRSHNMRRGIFRCQALPSRSLFEGRLSRKVWHLHSNHSNTIPG